jgi:flavin-dependent dehydrogenase
MQERFDVAVLGGGLAGLTLALQIKTARPETAVLIVERRLGAAPEATFKVGESTVEPGARYFAEMLGMREHIETRQLRKFGLRFFCPAGDNSDIARRVEIGPPVQMPLPSYQLDRGRFENELALRANAAGILRMDGTRVLDVEIAQDGDHTVKYQRKDAHGTLRARWVVDAAGRVNLFKKKFDLFEEVDHRINSVWFRLTGGMNIEDFSRDPAWLGRMSQQGLRMYSTNHMMGDGYWVWLINLASGPISIGVCADPRHHALDQMNDPTKVVEWLKKYEPQVGYAVEARGPDAIEDFLAVKDFAHGCRQVFSAQRWCLTGDAGCFVDPFCSPGSDFIAFSNSMIHDLVVRDLNGEAIDQRVDTFNEFYQLTFKSVLSTYTDLYSMLSNAKVFVPKFIMNAVMYWGVWSLLFFNGKTWDADFIRSVWPELERIRRLYFNTERMLRQWHALDRDKEYTDLWVSQPQVTALRDRVKDLTTRRNDDELRERFRSNLAIYEALAILLFQRAARALPSCPAIAGRVIDPYVVGLQPESWERDGLFDGTGMTPEAALALVPGIEHGWIDERVAERAAPMQMSSAAAAL